MSSLIEQTPAPRQPAPIFIVPLDLHTAFKTAAAAKGENMTDVLMKFIEDYVVKNAVELKKKGRR